MLTAIETVAPELAGTWDIDPAHSGVEFSARHAMVASVRGRFNGFSGTIEAGNELAGSTTEVTIEAASIDTGNQDRDNHLRSPDFLDVERLPTCAFGPPGWRPARKRTSTGSSATSRSGT